MRTLPLVCVLDIPQRHLLFLTCLTLLLFQIFKLCSHLMTWSKSQSQCSHRPFFGFFCLVLNSFLLKKKPNYKTSWLYDSSPTALYRLQCRCHVHNLHLGLSKYFMQPHSEIQPSSMFSSMAPYATSGLRDRKVDSIQDEGFSVIGTGLLVYSIAAHLRAL